VAAESLPIRKSRQHPRVTVKVVVELAAAGGAVRLATRNISVGGAALVAEAGERAQLPVGRRFSARLLDPENALLDPVTTIALVVRHDPGGIALRWIHEEMKTVNAISAMAELVAQLAARS
jgi:hypothetical protein